MSVAAIDIGTNSVLLTVAERVPDGTLRVLADCAAVTRLGEGVDQSRLLRGEAMRRTATAVAGFAAQARALGATKVCAVGTSALRDARNADAFARLLQECADVTLDVLPGEEEALLSYQAVRSDRSLGLPPGDLIVVDIGGGSVEFVHGDEERIRYRASLDCGAMRVTERFFHADPPDAAQWAAASRWLDEQLAALPDFPSGAPVAGIGGTFVNLASVRLGLREFDPERLHGQRLDAAVVAALAARFAALPTASRREIPGMEPARADVIHAGALLAHRILARLGSAAILVSVRGLRYGLLQRLLAEEEVGKHADKIRAFP